MLALMMLLALGIYLAVSTLVVWLAVRIARKLNRRGWLWGAMAAFAMYNLVFWDWIPTLVMHKYYCATEAGFWIYKTPEQWAKENPGVLETLKPWPSSKVYGPDKVRIKYAGGEYDGVNDRFGYWRRIEQNSLWHIHKGELAVMDIKTGEMLVKQIYYSSGTGLFWWRSWLNNGHCGRGEQIRVVAELAMVANKLHMQLQEN